MVDVHVSHQLNVFADKDGRRSRANQDNVRVRNVEGGAVAQVNPRRLEWLLRFDGLFNVVGIHQVLVGGVTRVELL
jgi:hypothetical protein